MNNIEEYQNLVELLRNTLKFYADKSNYPVNAGNEISRIEVDSGFQAQFALDKIKEIEAFNQKMEDDYNKVISETISAIENHPFDFAKKLIELKNIGAEAEKN